MLTFCPLFSGSSGNAIYVAYQNTRLLVDAGLSGKNIVSALEQIGVSPSSLNGILITHEHSDHIKGAGILSRKYHLPVYATEKTWRAMESSVGEVPCACRVEFDPAHDFYLQDIGIVPFAIPHDAVQPVGYRLFGGSGSAAVATDLGHMTHEVMENLSGADVVLLESNHDPEMLMANPRYSVTLKKRILGAKGHLSNDDSAKAALSLFDSGVRQLILGHLSGENNLPELAYRTVCAAFEQEGVKVGKEIKIDMAWRDHVGGVYTLADSLHAEGL